MDMSAFQKRRWLIEFGVVCLIPIVLLGFFLLETLKANVESRAIASESSCANTSTSGSSANASTRGFRNSSPTRSSVAVVSEDRSVGTSGPGVSAWIHVSDTPFRSFRVITR